MISTQEILSFYTIASAVLQPFSRSLMVLSIATVILSSVPIQHISQRLPKRFQSLFALLVVWHHSTSPDQHNLYLTWNGFTAHDIARYCAWEDMMPKPFRLLQLLHQLILLLGSCLHRI